MPKEMSKEFNDQSVCSVYSVDPYIPPVVWVGIERVVRREGVGSSSQ